MARWLHPETQTAETQTDDSQWVWGTARVTWWECQPVQTQAGQTQPAQTQAGQTPTPPEVPGTASNPRPGTAHWTRLHGAAQPASTAAAAAAAPASTAAPSAAAQPDQPAETQLSSWDRWAMWLDRPAEQGEQEAERYRLATRAQMHELARCRALRGQGASTEWSVEDWEAHLWTLQIRDRQLSQLHCARWIRLFLGDDRPARRQNREEWNLRPETLALAAGIRERELARRAERAEQAAAQARAEEAEEARQAEERQRQGLVIVSLCGGASCLFLFLSEHLTMILSIQAVSVNMQRLFLID